MSSITNVIEAFGVKKKHCRSLKHGMRYGLKDIFRELFNLHPTDIELRKEEFWALDDIDLSLKQGESVAIIGPNGSGKSTLLKLLNGIYWPDDGNIAVNGRVGSLLEAGAGFHPMLSGRENVYIASAILGLSKQEIDSKFDSIVEFSEIGDFIDTPVKHYSSGMFVRLGFSVALHCAPEVLLVDEVLAVGDAAFQRKCLKALKAYTSCGGTLIFVSHNMLAVNSIAERCIVLARGKTVFDGDVKKAIEKYYKQTISVPTKGKDVALPATINQLPDENRASIHNFSFGQGECPDPGITRKSPLVSGEKAWVKMTIKANQDIEETNVGFSFWEQTDLPLMTFNTQERYRFLRKLNKNETAEVCFSFTCPLASGRYNISAGIVSHLDGGFLDRKMNMLTIEVKPSGEEFGLVNIPYEVVINDS